MRICAIIKSRAGGYTLLEMLVVLLIVGLSLGTLLSLGLGSGAQNQQQRVEAFGQELRMLTQSSVLGGHSYGLDFYQRDAGTLCWRWMRLEGEDWIVLSSLPGIEDSEGAAGFGDSVWELRIEGLAFTPESAAAVLPESVNPQPDVVLYPTGESTAFVLLLTDSTGNADRVHLDLMGRMGVNETIAAPPL